MAIKFYKFTKEHRDRVLRDKLQGLSFQLKGKPDTQGWRSKFEENGLIPIEYNGRIYSKDHLLAYYKMMKEEPELIQIMKSNFPSVDYNAVLPLETIIQ